MRKDGYYWIKLNVSPTEWEVARWSNDDSGWFVCGLVDRWHETVILTVGPECVMPALGGSTVAS